MFFLTGIAAINRDEGTDPHPGPLPSDGRGRMVASPAEIDGLWRASVRLQPVLTDTHFHHYWHIQLDRRFHFIFNQEADFLFLFGTKIENQLIMDLQEH